GLGGAGPSRVVHWGEARLAGPDRVRRARAAYASRRAPCRARLRPRAADRAAGANARCDRGVCAGAWEVIVAALGSRPGAGAIIARGAQLGAARHAVSEPRAGQPEVHEPI